jgi:hypothetical protein
MEVGVKSLERRQTTARKRLERLLRTVEILLRAIVETVDIRGVKSRYLRKHKLSSRRFLKSVASSDLTSPPANGYKMRFQKSGEKMFTFLDHGGVAWNNNNAEHAIRRFAKYRKGRRRSVYGVHAQKDTSSSQVSSRRRIQQCKRATVTAFEGDNLARVVPDGWTLVSACAGIREPPHICVSPPESAKARRAQTNLPLEGSDPERQASGGSSATCRTSP